ncbi:unnamed protein product, partial [Meganyctiphanes norvegica]
MKHDKFPSPVSEDDLTTQKCSTGDLPSPFMQRLLYSTVCLLLLGEISSFVFLYSRMTSIEAISPWRTIEFQRGAIDVQRTSIQAQKEEFKALERRVLSLESQQLLHEQRKQQGPQIPSAPLGPDSHSRSRYKRRASDTSYVSNLEDGSLQLQLQDQAIDQDGLSEIDRSLLQLNSIVRIPYEQIQDFCAKTRSSCPPGPVGPPGPTGTHGSAGHRGDRGDMGMPGRDGPRGLTGMPGKLGPIGPMGNKGKQGPAGIDGRDGLPGEPGLDGIPGRNGLDGVPGADGLNGIPGMDGTPGINGTHGFPGDKGDRGHRGVQGPRGIAGPRGRLGKNGTPGTPGIPGITTYHVNGTEPDKLLIAPSIPGSTKNRPRRRKPIIVREGDNVRLRCQASGEPRPTIEWSREDGGAIPTGKWKDGSVNSHIFNMTHIRRDHTGVYRCEAYNGIPPNDYKTFNVEVHFDPYVRVNDWKVGTYNGSEAHLECHVEGFPSVVTYWEDKHGRILDNSTKHQIHYYQDQNFGWKSSMSLLIQEIDGKDFGDYHCVAKNELSVTRGLVKVHEIDPHLWNPSTGKQEPHIFGSLPPALVDLFDDLCPPPIVCPDCPKIPKCAEGHGALYGLRVEQFGNDTYPGFKNRSLDCMLSAVGKPVYHRHTDSKYGSWMRDPHPKDPTADTKYWTTDTEIPNLLFEFSDKNRYRKNKPSRNYSLPHQFTGNSMVVYNGSFYYQSHMQQKIIKYDLLTGSESNITVPELAVNGSNYLYKGAGRDYIDLNTDENGLWAIYGLPSNNNTIIMKIDPWTMKVEYAWNISLSNHKFGELFITCGVLYGIDSVQDRDTKIRFQFKNFRLRGFLN